MSHSLHKLVNLLRLPIFGNRSIATWFLMVLKNSFLNIVRRRYDDI